jgi:hypothetical protein
MDPLTRILIRLAQWHRNPPSRRYLWIAGIAVAVSIAIVLLERGLGWPDWLRSESVPIRRM